MLAPHARLRGARRRAAVAVYLAVSMTIIMGMAALAVDIGTLYDGQSELQRTADAAALAAASQLMGEGATDAQQAAFAAADEVAQKNPVLGETVGVDSAADVVLGKSAYDGTTGRFVFQPSGEAADAVRVTVRRTEGS